MSSVNKVIIVGRLGADPELTFHGERARANWSLATDRQWTDSRTGDRRKETDWHRCVAWGRTAELVGEYLAKGRQVYVEGRLQTRSWETDQGEKKYMTEVVVHTVTFLGSKSDNQSYQRPEQTEMVGGGGQGNYDYGPPPMDDQDVPF